MRCECGSPNCIEDKGACLNCLASLSPEKLTFLKSRVDESSDRDRLFARVGMFAYAPDYMSTWRLAAECGIDHLISKAMKYRWLTTFEFSQAYFREAEQPRLLVDDVPVIPEKVVLAVHDEVSVELPIEELLDEAIRMTVLREFVR